ncbi:hypothetical protein L873DRAFT_1803027 [Choiromyces venosus 120613-1]|uniref:Uncharacterized protein n=1 Tax=Choiromyces venosus 120613-1 TaxID=1336337 RepID=A0A3N4JTV6_9PEZI|nr:hypothetical protein L873DRAFT_1803027 [Choiromyces venosus 120613-1]
MTTRVHNHDRIIKLQSHLAIMDRFLRESSLLQTDPLGIYPSAPIQTVLAARDLVQNLSITNEKSGTLGIRYSEVRL